jgi:superfamily II DNA or RNA helicase
MQYRPYQTQLHGDIYTSWDKKNKNVAAVLPTGGGKTVVMSGVINDWTQGKVVAIAHRKELVGQIAMALAINGVHHSIIAPRATVNYVVNRQRQKLKTHFHNTDANVVVASVDTLISPSRIDSLASWREQVGLWVIDECHHIVQANKWGKATGLFPNAHGLGFTATLCRADGKGLGAHSNGVFHDIVEGPNMRDLINQGYLCDYKIYAPLTYMPLSKDDVGASGDYSSAKLKAASKKSKIVGDVVESYQNICPGKQAVVFATDLETAADMKANYIAAGIKAEMLSANTLDNIRTEILDRFERRELQVLINVDLLGEGFDCPGIEACIMARPTESYGLYCQQFGRALRILDGKLFALIIDHVGNVVRHGLPDAPRIWSLDARERSPKRVNPDDEIPLRYCPSCTQPYSRVRISCPYCGHEPAPDPRGKPEFVDGDVFEISPEVLAQLRGEIAKVDTPASEVAERMKAMGASPKAIGGAFKNIEARAKMQEALRESMGWWGAMENMRGHSDREAQRRFFYKFGIDVLTAQTLGRPEALALANKINEELGGW